MTAGEHRRGAGEVAVLLMFLRELLEVAAVDTEVIDTARERLLRSGGELWMDCWGEKVEAAADALAAAATSPRSRREFFQEQVETVEAGAAAVGVLPLLVRMYPDVASELPEALAGMVRSQVISLHGAVALLGCTQEVEEGEARLLHGIGVDRRHGAGVADA